MDQEKEYILGTEEAELHRLGVQHQVWASEAREGWRRADFKAGQVILDLGSGPGFASRDLAYIAGEKGKVIAVDQSKPYLDFLDQISVLHTLNIDTMHISFDDLNLEDNSLDRVYCRWALAWISNPEDIVNKIYKALKPGGQFLVHEYFDWNQFQTEPMLPNLDKAIRHAFRSFEEGEGHINIGRKLPQMFKRTGFDDITTRPMTKLMSPSDLEWQWPGTFLNIYLPKLSESGFMPPDLADKALADWDILESNFWSRCLCPQMIEIIGRK